MRISKHRFLSGQVCSSETTTNTTFPYSTFHSPPTKETQYATKPIPIRSSLPLLSFSEDVTAKPRSMDCGKCLALLAYFVRLAAPPTTNKHLGRRYDTQAIPRWRYFGPGRPTPPSFPRGSFAFLAGGGPTAISFACLFSSFAG